MPQPPASPDLTTAHATLAFLSRRLRTHQYRRNLLHKSHKHIQREQATNRAAIRSIIRRIQHELNAHPSLYAHYDIPPDYGNEST